jgi:2-polyprenyl-3-methyl-5-hydroxy-6-metoxy-1,4-benzoquinol methylase
LIESIRRRIAVAAASAPTELTDWLNTWNKGTTLDRASRDFSRQRVWGHNIDLVGGDIFKGAMGWRHLWNLEVWLSSGALPSELSSNRILVIGPWTGGDAAALASLGASVDVCEEVDAYRSAIAHLCAALRLPLGVVKGSLYELATERNAYDIVYCCGVLSHVSDPLVALRIAFNQLRVGGKLLLETSTSYSATGNDEFFGSNRNGWIWHNLSRLTVLEMLRTVGFDGIELVHCDSQSRVHLIAQKTVDTHDLAAHGLSLVGVA